MASSYRPAHNSKLTLTLGPEASAQFYNVLLCLSRFGESVSLEATPECLTLSGLNSSKSSHASFAFKAASFFRHYALSAGNQKESHFTCRLYNKALLSVFKGRVLESRNKDAVMDRCELTLQEGASHAECRIIVKVFNKHGINKTYRLTYEPENILHAMFDARAAKNHWKAEAKVLKGFTEYFGTGTEQLDVSFENGRLVFTSFTEKIMEGKEILKHPLETAVSAAPTDFESFQVRQKLHITINLKDFKAIVTHAETLKTTVNAKYSVPGRPLRFSYSVGGMTCDFTLMTKGDSGVEPAEVSSTAHGKGQAARPQKQTVERSTPFEKIKPVLTSSSTRGRPESRPDVRQLGRAENIGRSYLQPPNQDQALFVSPDVGDRRWDPPVYKEDYDDGLQLRWDAAADNENTTHPTFSDASHSIDNARKPGLTSSAPDAIAPTQRISQIRGLFD